MTAPEEPNPSAQWEPAKLRRTWEALGSEDPFWAVLAAPDAIGGRWDDAAFWETGRAQVRFVFDYLGDHGIGWRRGLALDFGCGVGRIAGPLADHFDRVVGLDAARSMLGVARTSNPAGRRVLYVHSADPRLPFRDAAFDFVYSHLVLQHCGPDAALRYVAEFARVLAPAGLAVFTMPTRLGDSTARTWLGRPVKTGAGVVSMDMASVPMGEMLEHLDGLGVTRERVFTSRDDTGVEYGVYVVRKPASGPC
jgi:SAM-dependent methyltransferase